MQHECCTPMFPSVAPLTLADVDPVGNQTRWLCKKESGRGLPTGTRPRNIRTSPLNQQTWEDVVTRKRHEARLWQTSHPRLLYSDRGRSFKLLCSKASTWLTRIGEGSLRWGEPERGRCAESRHGPFSAGPRIAKSSAHRKKGKILKQN